METAIWQEYNQSEVLLLGISNTSNQNIVNNFIEENSLTYPILFDPGSSGGVQGGNTYDSYYMPNDGSPYPRDFIVDQNGIIAYANNEIDTAWMLSVIDELLFEDSGLIGDINQDGLIDILDIIVVLNYILGNLIPSDNQFILSDINSDEVLNILDVVLLVNFILN